MLSARVVLGLRAVLHLAVVAHSEEDRVSLLQHRLHSAAYQLPEDNDAASDDNNPPLHVITGASSPDHPICVALYYTSYCPKTMDWVKYQLPALMRPGANVEMAFVPYGYQLDEPASGRGCQHGEIECYSNAMHRCALRLLDNATQARHCDAQSPFLRSQPLETSLYVKFLQCHSPAIWQRTTQVHKKTKDIIVEEGEACMSSLGQEQRWSDMLSCADAAWERKSADHDFQRAGDANRIAAKEFLPTFRVRCPGDEGLLQAGAVLPEDIADGSQKIYNFLAWIRQLCQNCVWPAIGHNKVTGHDEHAHHQHHHHDMDDMMAHHSMQ